MGNDELREILEEFFTEAGENLDAMESDMIQMENTAEAGEDMDAQVVDRLFRVLHTLKGGAGFLSLDVMAKVAHAGENLLDEVRGGKIPVSKPVIDALLQTNDVLRDLLEKYKADEDTAGLDFSALITELERLSNPENTAATPAAASAPVEPAPQEDLPEGTGIFEEEPTPEPDDSVINQDLLAEVQADDSLDPSKDAEATTPAEENLPPPIAINEELLAEVESDDSLDPSKDTDAEAAAPATAAPVADESLVNQDLLAEVESDDSLNPELDGDPEPEPAPAAAASTPEPTPASTPESDATTGPALKRGEDVPERREGPAARRQQDDRRQAPGRRVSDASQETIRVEVERLDKVMNLVGELVLARNSLNSQLNHPEVKAIIEEAENQALIQGSMEQLSRVTQDLQMSVLSTRMQPIKKVFDKIPRQVRELKNQLGREVDLIIEGEMTEVDKSLVEELSDPMVHMIRNALDHGIEPPEDRKAAGKHPTGTLCVRAFYEGNNVVVQVQEDGKGIDPQKIKAIAIKKGVINETAAASMSDDEAIRLIMAAGFSTAEQISDVSGRGVGMDVVNSKIMSLKGTLDIKSELGLGTTFSIYLPLTLAIVQALVVSSNTEGFAIPIGDISEVIKFKPEAIHRMNEQDVIELRGEALPLFYLSSLTKKGFVPPQILETVQLPPEKPTAPTPEATATPTPEPAAAETEETTEEVAEVVAKPPADVEGLSIEELERVAAESAGMLEQETQTQPEESALAKLNGAGTQGFIVVVRDGTNTMGLVVDQLIGQEEAVVKPVTEVFEFHDAVSGATITGDGHVHMILDIPYMLKNLSA